MGMGMVSYTPSGVYLGNMDKEVVQKSPERPSLDHGSDVYSDLPPSVTPEQKAQLEDDEEAEEYVRSLRSLYDSGAPWFTKARLKAAGQQLEQFAARTLENNELRFEGVNGKTNVWPVSCLLWADRDYKPSLCYQTFFHMTYEKPERYERNYASISPVSSRYPKVINEPPLSASELSQLLNDGKKQWEATPQYRELKAHITSNPMLSNARKIIGFALGTLVPSEGTDGREIRSLMQYALLLSLRELVAAASGSDEVLCFAQDPHLEPAPIETLQKAGVTVLNDPAAFLEVDDTTILISICPNVPVQQIVTDIARPAGILWDLVALEKYGGLSPCDPPSTRIEAMLENEYTKLTFPSYEPYFAPHFYVRKE
ncbi:hypothetical protein O1611_g9123 [Lasiodiplodia mahajangana]|uniref:Uncharacterized protein n=1 Tax=Lasiodiplodia mahajangana TaxID=1108764 RepID=A0ACC2JAU5_9PEZI|nr:hypothetical protein O1611_g9123 [Lasiodiplodia mahajangana]